MSAHRIHRLARAALIGAVALASSVLFLTPAAADPTTYLRLAHLSPDTPEVDVYVASVADPGTSVVVLTGVEYGTLSDYQVLPSGPYIVSMRPAGAAADTPAVIATTLAAATGAAYTVAGVGSFADLGLTVLTDDLSLPPGGQARARVIQASVSQPELDVTVQNGASLGRSVDFATTTPYRNVLAGQWMLRVSADNLTLAELPITVDAGAVYSVLILDTPAGLALGLQVDASAPGVVPAGGVETGSGGFAADTLAGPEGQVASGGTSAGTESSSSVPAISLMLVGLALLGIAAFVAVGTVGTGAGAGAGAVRRPQAVRRPRARNL